MSLVHRPVKPLKLWRYFVNLRLIIAKKEVAQEIGISCYRQNCCRRWFRQCGGECVYRVDQLRELSPKKSTSHLGLIKFHNSNLLP